MSSLCSWPGVRRWTCGSKKAGKACRALGVDLLEAADGGLARCCQLGDLAVADDDVVLGVDAGHGVEHGGTAQDQVRALAGAHVQLGQAHAGCPIGVGRSAPLPWAGAGSPSPEASSS